MRACSRPVQEASQASRWSRGWRVSRREVRSESGWDVSAISASLRSVGSVSSELVGASTGFGARDSPLCTFADKQSRRKKKWLQRSHCPEENHDVRHTLSYTAVQKFQHCW